MTLTFYRYGSTDTTDTLELDEAKSSIIDKLNEPTRLSAILTSETAPQIALGNYTTYGGTRYYITKEPTVRKEHSRLYAVEVELERSLGLARITILANPVDHRTTFDYTATATEHLQLIVDCLNAKYEEVGLKWTRGAVLCKDTVKHIKYDGATVLGALQQIRETYETDIFADGETLSLGQTDDKTAALPLAYGKGKGLLSGLERYKHTDDTVPSRLYVTGTKRNMVKGRLTLEKDVVLAVDLKSGAIERKTGGMSIKPDEHTLYRTDLTGQYIAEWSPTDKFAQSWRRFPTEATYTNEEVYPSHVSTIKTVTKVKDHYEVNSDLNYTKLLIDGEQMQVVFQTGNLAGRDFDAKHYTSTGRLAIVPKEEDDTTLPNDTLCPKVGDQYIVTGVKLPDQYIREAERNLTNEALRHLIKLQETRYSYKADIDPVYLHNNHDTIAPQLAVGRYVRLTDPQIAIGDPYIRIVGKRTYLDRPYTPELELSNELEPPSELTRVLNELDRQDNGLTSILDRLHGFGGELAFSSERVHKLTSELESHKTATDKSFAELSDHPLTIDKDGYWQVWSVKDSKYLTTQYQSRGRDGQGGKDAAPIRPNLFCFGSLDKNSREQGGLRIDEVTVGKRLSAGTFNIHGGRDLTRVTTGVAVQLDLVIYRTARENGEWKRYLTLRTIRHPNDVIYYVSSKPYPEEPGTYHIELNCPISEEQSKNPKELYIHGWLLDWGRGFMDCELRNVKVEYLYEGEPQRCSAYIPNTSDMIPLLPKIENGEWLLPDQLTRKYLSTGIRAKGKDGNPGKDAPPIRPNLLRGFMGQVVNIKAKENDNYNYRLIIDKKWIEDNKAYVASADFELIEGEKQAEVTLLFRLNGVPNMYSHTPLNGKSKGRVSIYIPAGVYNTDGVFGYAGRAGKTKGVAARYSNIKLEEVQDGEPKEASAYLPHTDDLKVPLSSVVKDLKEQGISSEVKELLKADNSFVLATKGEAGHSPAPEEVLGTSRFAELLGSEVTQQVKPVKDNLDTANTNISNLQKVALTPQQRTDLGYLTYSLQLLKSGGNGTLEGLSLQRYIALSGDKQTVSAYLASNALPAVLKAGITGFGTPNEREQVEITHTGTGHLGNLYFSGSQIDFRTSRDDDPYLSIGAEENQFIDDFLDTARLDDTPVSVGTVTLTTSTTSTERTVDVANDGTRLTVSIGDITVETFRGATTRLSLDGEVLDEWRGNISMSGGGSIGGIVIEPQHSESPYIASNLSYERVVKAGRHTLRIEIIKPTSGATATIRGLRVRRRYDTGRQQSALTKSGLRLFGSPDRYFDVDYRPTYQAHLGAGYDFNLPNPYLVRIKGGAKVDKLTVDELDMPGVPLCGASFNENGGQEKAFGKRAKRQGGDRAQAVYDYGMTAYKVYHSIGHTNYIPIVQVSGWTSGDLNWSLTPRVYDVKPDYFVVRILTNNDNPQKKAISYVAYKTE